MRPPLTTAACPRRPARGRTAGGCSGRPTTTAPPDAGRRRPTSSSPSGESRPRHPRPTSRWCRPGSPAWWPPGSRRRGASRSCPTARRWSASGTATRIKLVTAAGEVSDVGSVRGVDGERRGRAARPRALPDVRRGPDGLRVLHRRRRERHRADDVRRQRAGRPADGVRRHPVRADPQRRPDRVRPGRFPLRRHRRGRAARPVAGPGRPAAARSCGSRRTASRRPATRPKGHRCGASGTATCRASPGTSATGCGPASSARTPGTS